MNMEELCSTFDDTFFESTSRKSRRAIEPYVAKQYDPLWFQDQNCDVREKYKLESAGNWNYRTGNFAKALKCFQNAIGLIKSPSRELNEAILRCHVKLRNDSQALECLAMLTPEKDSKNLDQRTSFLNLAVFVYSHLSMFNEEISALKQLCTFHSCEPSVWCSLADCYGRLVLKMQQENDKDVPSFESVDIACNKKSSPTLQSDPNVKLDDLARDSRVNGLLDNSCSRKESCGENSCTDIMHELQPETCEKSSCENSKHSPNTECSISNENRTKLETEDYKTCNQDVESDITNQSTISSRPGEAVKRDCDWLQLRCYMLVCLKRALFLCEIVEKNLRSFAMERNTACQEKINKQISSLQIPGHIKTHCLESVYSISFTNREHDAERDDKHLLSLLPNAVQNFNDRWFSWILT